MGARATKTTERSLKFSTTSSYLMGEKKMKTKKVLPRQKRERFAPTSVLYCPGENQLFLFLASTFVFRIICFFLRPFFCVCVCQKRRGSNRFFTFLVATDRDVFKAKDFWLFFHFYLCFFFSLGGVFDL